MIRVHTRRVVTFVAQDLAVGYRANNKLIGHPMGTPSHPNTVTPTIEDPVAP